MIHKTLNYCAPNWKVWSAVTFAGMMPDLHTVPSKGIDVTYLMKQALGFAVRNGVKKKKERERTDWFHTM